MAARLNQEGRLEELYRLWQSHPEDPVLTEYLVWTGLEQGRPDVVVETVEPLGNPRFSKLIEEVRARLETEPENPNLRFALGFLLYRRQRFQSAAEVLVGLTVDSQWYRWALNLLGLCYSDGHHFNPDKAAYYFTQVVEALGDEPSEEYHEVFVNYASCLHRDGRPEQALELLRRLKRLNPDYPALDHYIDLVERGAASKSSLHHRCDVLGG